ncbi:hypothetical protein F5876DRAFT_69933, partial [Lentinula aff. lateritia]
NPSHAALLEGRNDPHPLAIRGEGQSKVDRSKDKGKKANSQSSDNAIEPIPVYFFDCGSVVPFQDATLKPGYLYKSAWYLELNPDHPSVFRPQCNKKYRVTKYWLAPRKRKVIVLVLPNIPRACLDPCSCVRVLDLTTYSQSDATQVISTNMEIKEKLKGLKKSSKLPENLRRHKKAMDAYDVVIMYQPSGRTLYVALLNEEATRSPTLKYDQRHDAEYLEDAWKAMKHAEGYSGSAAASENDGDWSTDDHYA